MREIKFQGKTLDGEWVYGFLFELSIDGCSITCIGTEPLSANDYSEIYKSCYEEVISETVGQYTGLKDKNGVEIYEGDILKTRIGGYEQESPYVVEDMRKLYFELKRDDSYYRIQETEVIGNIYDNPELYKERENGSEGTEDV